MKFMENVYITPEKIRSICIKENWYTRGTEEDYGKLLAMPYKGHGPSLRKVTHNLLYKMSCDILIHSDFTETEWNNESVYNTIKYIMDTLNNNCSRYIHILD